MNIPHRGVNRLITQQVAIVLTNVHVGKHYRNLLRDQPVDPPVGDVQKVSEEPDW